MSRLTASPFHKPSAFQFPHPPLSPPDTIQDIIPPFHTSAPVNPTPSEYRQDTGAQSAALPVAVETPGSRFRKVSSISYHSSGLRNVEPRERPAQRNHKSFLVVIPPASFIHQHGQLGHTLSTGPRERLSHGIIMPLFPTMYGQLAAIAREFNFPSTTGLCLYLQLNVDGIAMTPRISDESWQVVWSHLLDATTPSPSLHGLSVGGKLEFDIDLRQARWYASWISSLHREHEVPLSAFPSAAPSNLGENRTSVADDYNEQSLDNMVTPRRNAQPATRHVPRKLSLVDRFDVMSARSDSRPPSRSALSPPDQHLMTAAQQLLSPIVQEEEPKSAQHNLDDKVNQWRASAVLKPTTRLATTGQISLEPANMPNHVALDDDETTSDRELNLQDYTWSVTSAGPEDYDPLSPLSWERVPSVHLASRLEGSVCLTPSVCTSFGPSDYTLESPTFSIPRLPTPDIAHRMLEDVPLTPSTVTSWGPLSSYPPSPISYYRAPSVDLGERMVFSRPCTPSTATSWGPADLSWAPSPISGYSPRSVHLADRAELSSPNTPSFSPSYSPWPHMWPYNRNTHFDERKTSEPVLPCRNWPYNYASLLLASVSEPNMNEQEVFVSIQPWKHIWPYNRASSNSFLSSNSTGKRNHIHEQDILEHIQPWNHNWPYNRASSSDFFTGQSTLLPDNKAVNLRKGGESSLRSSRILNCYPFLNIYPPIYPHFEIYIPASGGNENGHIISSSDNINTESDRTGQQLGLISVKIVPKYPIFEIYPALYPTNLVDIYPALDVSKSSFILGQHYPVFDLYPAVYPEVESYSKVSIKKIVEEDTLKEESQSVHLNVYPALNIYPSVYPYFDIYPADIIIQEHSSCARCPGFYSCKERNTGSAVNMFQGLPQKQASVYPDFNLYPPLECKNIGESLVVVLHQARYPMFDLYPAIYPNFSLYPSAAYLPEQSKPARKEGPLQDLNTAGIYPNFDIYPSIIYPAAKVASMTKLPTVRYPVFDLYPAVYPHFNLYPYVAGKDSEVLSTAMLPVIHYPVFVLYPAVYPHFNLYPYVSGENSEVSSKIMLPVIPYPVFDLYPAVYPHFDIYPSISGLLEGSKSLATSLQTRYPSLIIYPAVYPFFDLWPTASVNHISPPAKIRTSCTRLTTSSRLTHSELHAMVMMESKRSFGSRSMRRRPRTHLELHQEVFLASMPRSTWSSVTLPPQSLPSSRLPEITSRRKQTTPRTGFRSSSSRIMLSPAPSPSPSRVLPPLPPSNRYLTSDGFEMITPLVSEEEPQHTHARGASHPPRLSIPQVNERRIYAGESMMLNRSNSMLEANKADPSISVAPKRRDSMVLSRVRAYNSVEDTSLTSDTLAKFPMPPSSTSSLRRSHPKAPKALDRSKYPFM